MCLAKSVSFESAFPHLKDAIGGAAKELYRQCASGQAGCYRFGNVYTLLRLETDTDTEQKTLVAVAVAGKGAVNLEQEFHAIAKRAGATQIRLHATGSERKIGLLGRMYQRFFKFSPPRLIEAVYSIEVK